MAKLIYTAIMSLDGYIEDAKGEFDWSAPDEEAHQFINDLERPVGTYLYGRTMYEVMSVWENPEFFSEGSAVTLDFAAIWQAADKIVYSRTLESVSTARTRIEHDFDREAIRQLKRELDRDIDMSGSNLAGQMIKAGLVDEWRLFVNPVIIGGGKRALPDGVLSNLELQDERQFGNGVMYLNYRTKG